MQDYDKLLQRVEQLSQKDKNQMFAIALKSENIIAIEIAILLGADVTANNNEAIRSAHENGYPRVVEFLRKSGATLPTN